MFVKDSSINRAVASLSIAAVFLVIAAFTTPAFVGQRTSTTVPASQGKAVSANDFPGTDIGAKINAADRALGAAPGEITIKDGGTISTQIVISSNHVLRLGPGTYVSRTANIPILMRERTSLIGSGWDQTIITESTAKDQYTVISAYNHAQENGTADSGITIRELQVKGANPGFNSAPQAVSLGNCSDCLVDKVWINGTRSIGMQLGGSARKGFFAANSKVTNCLFTRVASQNLALVNGKNILFEGNRFMKSGQVGGPGNTNIDLEVNEGEDRLENVIIRNNLIDVRNSDVSPTGNGIVINSTSGTPYIGPILIEKNTIIGGETQGTPTNVMSNGIYAFGTTMRDVTIRDNIVRRTGQSGIRIEGTRFVVTNNQFFDVGGGGNPGFVVIVTNSQITGNTFEYSGNGPADGSIHVLPGSSNNVFQNNRGWGIVGNIR